MVFGSSSILHNPWRSTRGVDLSSAEIIDGWMDGWKKWGGKQRSCPLELPVGWRNRQKHWSARPSVCLSVFVYAWLYIWGLFVCGSKRVKVQSSFHPSVFPSCRLAVLPFLSPSVHPSRRHASPSVWPLAWCLYLFLLVHVNISPKVLPPVLSSYSAENENHASTDSDLSIITYTFTSTTQTLH